MLVEMEFTQIDIMVKFDSFLQGKNALMVFKKTPSLCNNCFEKMGMREVDVGVSPTEDPKKISILLIDVGFLWKWNPEICSEAKAICDACEKIPAKWLFDHLNENFLPTFKKREIDAGAYFFVNANFTHSNIIDYFEIQDRDIVNHKILIINGNNFKKEEMG